MGRSRYAANWLLRYRLTGYGAGGREPEYGTLLWAMLAVMRLCQGRVLRSSDSKKQFLQASVWLISSTASRAQVPTSLDSSFQGLPLSVMHTSCLCAWSVAAMLLVDYATCITHGSARWCVCVLIQSIPGLPAWCH